FLKGVSKKKSGLKIIASFGGSVVPSELFAFLTCDEKRRGAFVNNLIEFTLAHGFHGVDLAWLYPAPQERDQYIRLLRDIRCACDRNGLVFTVTVPSRPSVIEVNYPVEKLEKFADFVILCTNDYRKLRKTSIMAPLYSSSPGSSNSIDYHVDRWKMAGLSCKKIVIVIQTMTLTYKLYIQNEYRVGTPALQLKIRPYYKICRKLYSGSLEIWDSNAKSPYAFRDLSWYSYENEKSIKEKVGFVVQQGLAGLAVFYYDEDDPINICGDGQYPLTAIVVAALQSQYLPPSVITDSQIYHYDSPSLTPPSQLDYRHYSEVNSNQPLAVYVEDKQPNNKAFLPDVSKIHSGTQFVTQQQQHKSSSLSFNAKESSSPVQISEPISSNGYSSVERMFYDAESGSDEYQDGFNFAYEEIELGPGADMVLTNTEASMVVKDPVALPSTVQLFSEAVQSQNSHTCQLFSEQPRNHPVVYTSGTSCKGCSTSKPCPHCASLPSFVSHAEQHTSSICPCKYPGIKIFATGHAATPATTTTTTTMAPPVIHFFTMAPPTLKPPTCCHGCQQCVKVVATSSADVPNVAGHSLPCPCTTPAPVGAQGHLYSEHSFVSSGPGVQIQAQAVAGSPIVHFTPFEVKLCPHDGILHDPHDRRSYYLCKRGLPMSDENKFSCAHGYIFSEASKKCVPEGSFK
ncbi:uncharacterized protein LOC125769453, partial [Anopheles funestus]|uniref:uncharacterized protein LOC125769453 n=1 Tax=Anopheles funestus TaxID=62324 RepID=UPI0020C6FAFF